MRNKAIITFHIRTMVVYNCNYATSGVLQKCLWEWGKKLPKLYHLWVIFRSLESHWCVVCKVLLCWKTETSLCHGHGTANDFVFKVYPVRKMLLLHFNKVGNNSLWYSSWKWTSLTPLMQLGKFFITRNLCHLWML